MIRTTGFLAIDPLLGTLFGMVLVHASRGIIRNSVQVLMDSMLQVNNINGLAKDRAYGHSVRSLFGP